MKTILFAILASCLALASCEKNETYIKTGTGELRVIFTGEREITSVFNVYSIDQTDIAIAACKVHGPSRTALIELNTGSYFIRPYTFNQNPCGFQIRNNKRTILKIDPIESYIVEIEYEDL